MAKIRIVVLVLLAVIILALAISETSAQKQKQKQQRPKHPNNGNGQGMANKNKPGKQKQKQKQKQKENSKVFVTSVPILGRLRGRTIHTDWTGKPIIQFLDIPYGSVTTRFQAAQPAAPWKGALDAHHSHPGCPSIQELLRFAKLEDNGVDLEDCLRLTVSTKSMETNELAPVMVYLHGDFLYDGDSVEGAPGYLLERDVVLVSVRYRLGPFGFLSTMSEEIPGNAAVTDVMLALEWIQKHIASFGGDPTRVTLFGQSGGAALANVLTLSPVVPKGLFHRVIYQSATALSPSFITDSPLAGTKDIARIAGCKQVNKLEPLHKCLMRMNATMLLAAFSVHGESSPLHTGGSFAGVQFVIGGPSGILPEHPGRLLAAEKFQAYPTMGGSVKHGGTFMMRDIFTDTFNETIMDDTMTGEQYIERVIKQANGEDPSGAWMTFAKDEIFSAEDIKNGTFKRLTSGLIDLCSTISQKNPVLLMLQANAKKLPKSTFLYTFDYEGDMNRYGNTADEAVDIPFDMGVSLTDDNLYLFPWPRFHLLTTSRDIKIAKRMVDLWTSFAATGVPQVSGSPAWAPMTDETGPYMKIGRTMAMGENYLDEYSVTTREAKSGYCLVNEDFYDIEAVLKEVAKEEMAAKEEEEEDAEEQETDAHEGRGHNLVFIARNPLRNRIRA